MSHRSKENPFRFIKLIHRIQSVEIKPHGFGQKNRSESVDSSTEHLEFGKISQVLWTVIHHHYAERKTGARWQKTYKSGTMD